MGKLDCRRPLGVSAKENARALRNFGKGYDRIFRKKPKRAKTLDQHLDRLRGAQEAAAELRRNPGNNVLIRGITE